MYIITSDSMCEKINKSALITLLVVLRHLPTSPALSLSLLSLQTLSIPKKQAYFNALPPSSLLPPGLTIYSPLCLGDQVFQGLKSLMSLFRWTLSLQIISCPRAELQAEILLTVVIERRFCRNVVRPVGDFAPG